MVKPPVNNPIAAPSETGQDGQVLCSSIAGASLACSHYSMLLRSIVLGIPLALLYGPPLGEFLNSWFSGSSSSYVLLVPFVTVYLVWLQKPALQKLTVEPAIGAGLIWLVLALLLLLVSQAGSIMTTQRLALALILPGLVLALGGYGYLKALAFPFAYLTIFMTTILGDIIDSLKWPFQLITASMATSMLQWFGIPAILDNDRYLVLPTVILEVARGCSGAEILIAVLAIGLPLAYLGLKTLWSRIVLVVSAVMIAIVANWIRVTAIGIYMYWGGKEVQGLYHMLHGILIYVVSFAFLFTAAWVLRKLEGPETPRPSPREQNSSSNEFSHRRSPAMLATLTLTVGVVCLHSFDGGATVAPKSLAAFPFVVGDWVGEQTTDTVASAAALKSADDSLMRTYRSPDGRRVQLFIGYFASQRHGKELVGMATAPLHARAVPAVLQERDIVLPINRTAQENGDRHMITDVYYYIDGRSYADPYRAKLATIRQAFTQGRTDGAIVIISGDAQTDEKEEQRRLQEQFSLAAFPLITEYLP